MFCRCQRVKLDARPLVSDVTSTRDNDEPSFPLVPSKAAAAAKKAKAAAAAGKAASSAAAAAPAAAQQAAAATAETHGSAISSSWRHEVNCEGKPVTHMVVSVQLPACAGSSGSSSWSQDAVQVELCGTQLKVSVDHHKQQQQQGESFSRQRSQQEPAATCINLPFAASQQGAAAELRGSTGQLVVKLPYLPLQQWVQQMEQEAPHAFSKLPLAHAAYMELDD